MATPGLVRPLPDADLMPEELRAAIVLFASLLDERHRRLFAGLESLKCGWGGDRRIAQLLGIDPSTVATGRRQLVERDVEVDRVEMTGNREVSGIVPQSLSSRYPLKRFRPFYARGARVARRDEEASALPRAPRHLDLLHVILYM